MQDDILRYGRARRSRNQTECDRPRAQQLGTVDALRDDPVRDCGPELLRPGRPHSVKFLRAVTILGDTDRLAICATLIGYLS